MPNGYLLLPWGIGGERTLAAVDLEYIDSLLKHVESDLWGTETEPSGAEATRLPQFWRYVHWGYYEDPATGDDSPRGYYAAAESLTRRILAAAGVADGETILDVGCGFGGTLDLIASRYHGCRLVGINLDERQVQTGQRLLAAQGEPGSEAIAFVTADGCRLPLPDATLDRVLAVECVFHFPSRKAFFREVARVLKPGGTLALSDFVVPAGSLPAVLATMTPVWFSDAGSGGEKPVPPDATGALEPRNSGRYAGEGTYRRLSRIMGLEILQDEDITAHTVPTYAALRHMHREANDHATEREAEKDLMGINGQESLALRGDLQYRLLSFRKASTQGLQTR